MQNKEYNPLPDWKQVEEEKEDYQYFHEQQEKEDRRIIDRIKLNGFIQGYNPMS